MVQYSGIPCACSAVLFLSGSDNDHFRYLTVFPGYFCKDIDHKSCIEADIEKILQRTMEIQLLKRLPRNGLTFIAVCGYIFIISCCKAWMLGGKDKIP